MEHGGGDDELIRDGIVSGILPKSEAFAVNYPGYPSSTSRAIQTLGGLVEIAKARSDSGDLELRFRPEDPFSHPAFSQPRPFAGLLLRIRKTRPKPDNPGGEQQLLAKVTARVNDAYHFEGMVDYQHVIPVHVAEAKRRKRKQCPTNEDTDLVGSADADHEDVTVLVPPLLFSLKDMPEDLVLKSSANVPKNMQRKVVKHRWEMDIEPCLEIAFDIDRIPIKVDWESNIPTYTEEWKLQLAVSKLFEERPIWPKCSLYDRLLGDSLEVTQTQMKRFLFRTGYYFNKGPFGKFWIRKGYDPRNDPESRIYQRVEFRVPRNLRYLTDDGSKQAWKDVCQFQVMPMKNYSLQFIELSDDFIQQEIKKPTNQRVCNHTTGWFSGPMHNMLVSHVKKKFLLLFPKGTADDLLQTTSEQVKSAGKLESRSRHSKPETEHQNVNQGFDISAEVGFADSTVQEVELDAQDDKCENENDEDDEEEEEEDPDGYEFSPAVGEDGSFSPQTGSYNVTESIPSDYLQELLRGFPFGNDGINSKSKGVDDADSSDGEFQIYEQDSDGSDDD